MEHFCHGSFITWNMGKVHEISMVKVIGLVPYVYFALVALRWIPLWCSFIGDSIISAIFLHDSFKY